MFQQFMKFCLTRSNIRLRTGLISQCLERKTLHLCDFWTENLSAHWRGANQHIIGPNILIPFLWNVIMNTIWNEIHSTFWSEIKTNLKMEWFSFRSHNVVFPFQFQMRLNSFPILRRIPVQNRGQKNTTEPKLSCFSVQKSDKFFYSVHFWYFKILSEILDYFF